jgi:hypothetical protein
MAPLKANRWQGHLPGTSLALSALLERAARGGVQFTAAERSLFTACEFWVAVKTRTLAAHLGAYAADALRSQSIVYSAMGAHHVARVLIAGIGEIDSMATPSGRLECLTALQQHIADTADPVDQLIAGLAHNLGLSAVAWTYRVAGGAADLGAARSLTGRHHPARESRRRVAGAKTNGARS